MNPILRSVVKAYRTLPMKPFKSAFARAFESYTTLYVGKRVISEVDGLKYELDLGELQDRSIYFAGYYEPATSAALLQLAKPGMNVLDIGANIGWHATRLGKRVSPGLLVAFEPMSWARRKLIRNLELNKLENVVVESIALSDQDHSSLAVHFRSSWTLEPDNRRPNEDPASMGAEQVRFMRLDSYVADKKLRRIDLIKLDVDGYELKVLRGGVGLLSRWKPSICLELGSWTLERYGDKLNDLIDFLSSLGYNFHDEENWKPFESKEELLQRVPSDGTINVIAAGVPARPIHKHHGTCGESAS